MNVKRLFVRSKLEVGALREELESAIEGEARFDAGSRALYATDASNYRQVPIGVVIPRSIDDVIATVAAARRHGAPLLPRGGGTSLAGQCCNVAVVMDFSKYLGRVLEIDPAARRARVEPGTVLDVLRAAAAPHGLTFGPDPSTHDHCTLGGMIGNNSCGVHSVLAEFRGPGARTGDSVESLDVLTADGIRMRVGATSDAELARILREGGRRAQIYRDLVALRDRYAGRIRERFPVLQRRVSGYDLPQLLPERGFHVARALVGSEGTCVTLLEATVTLVPSPPARALVVLGFEDVFAAADAVPAVRAHRPIALEGLDDVLVGDMEKKGLHTRQLDLLPPGRGWLLAELGGETLEDASAQARALMRELGSGSRPPQMKLYEDSADAHRIWVVRESGLGATARVPGENDTWEGWEDSAVPPERLGSYLRGLRALLERHGYRGALYGHFGQGCVHTRIDFDLVTRAGIERFRAFLDAAAELVIAHGGSLSGEHGDGQSRAELLTRMYGAELVGAFREFKAIWDPEGRMNPGKIVDPYRIVDNLRLGTHYAPPELKTRFAYPGDDQGSFARATLRCVGVGACRKRGAGTMCPSYMATGEEMHSTRGRARLLFEMLEGEVVRGGWRDPQVREALDLCLACKACKHECPVNVDMATYKAEFLWHHYAGRLRPRSAYALGGIYWWARLASLAPGAVNRALQSPRLGALAKRLAGIAPERSLPRFAEATFTRQLARRGASASGPRVLLWPDTFTQHFEPQIALAAADALAQLGFRVTVPPRSLCCGRPLYDFGMLDRARALLRQILTTLRAEIRAGIPLIGLEPSCIAVFRDELPALFPRDEDAKRLSGQSYLLSEFLDRRAAERELPRREGRALVQAHCHQNAVLDASAQLRVLERMGVEARALDAGCCGMAGSFGFEAEHYEVSQRIGERVLFPALREAAADLWIVADGFSCREQIRQATGRRALHLAELLGAGGPAA